MALALKEVGFGSDKMGNPVTHDYLESLGISLYNIFVMVPGSLPSLPKVGVDIKSYLYQLEDTINTDELRDKIFYSCSELLSFIKVSDVNIQEVELNNSRVLSILVTVNLEDQSFALVSVLRKGVDNEVMYSFRAAAIKAAS